MTKYHHQCTAPDDKKLKHMVYSRLLDDNVTLGIKSKVNQY